MAQRAVGLRGKQYWRDVCRRRHARNVTMAWLTVAIEIDREDDLNSRHAVSPIRRASRATPGHGLASASATAVLASAVSPASRSAHAR